MEQYYRQLVKHIAFRMSDQSMAADIVHDAYIKVIEVAAERHLEYPQAVLYKAATNLMIDHFRRLKRRNGRSLDDVETLECNPADTPQARHYLLQRASLIDSALGELSATCRQAFLLRKIEGLGHIEISERLQISKDMVEKHIVVAMKHCRIRVREMEFNAPRKRHLRPFS